LHFVLEKMREDVERLASASVTLAKMFYRRGYKWTFKLIDGTYAEEIFEKPKKGNLNLLKKANDIFDYNTKYHQQNFLTTEKALENLSGQYDNVLVRWVISLKAETVKDVISQATELGCDRICVIWLLSQTPYTKASIQSTPEAIGIDFETFSVLDLESDKSEHVLVPKHELVSLEDRAKYFETWGLTEEEVDKIPVLLPSDPICLYYAFRKGSLIRITSNSGTLKESTTFRIVREHTTPTTKTMKVYKEKIVVPNDQRKYSNYMSPAEYPMVIAKTVHGLISNKPPDKYLERKDLKIIDIAIDMVNDRMSDVVIERPHMGLTNEVEHWHLKELVLPKI
jgi:DNA-directed RNA polymerase I, II, and III subunit RPABC1